MVEVSGITYSYGRHQVLRGAGLSAAKGQCVGIAGANGCGKSTLLAILAGALRPRSGSIRYGQKDPLRQKKYFPEYTGYVPQENPLIPELSVRDNLRLWYCQSRSSMKQELEAGLLSMLELDRYLNKPVGKLSGGMKKRVSIACALANRPPILLLDEPGAAVDLPGKEEIRSYLEAYLKEQGTIIITTHEESELSLCHRLYAMKDGALHEISKDLRGRELMETFRVP